MVETIIFHETLGDSPIIRVLDFLLEGRTTLHRIWDKMLKSGLVVPTREIGKGKIIQAKRRKPCSRRIN